MVKIVNYIQNQFFFILALLSFVIIEVGGEYWCGAVCLRVCVRAYGAPQRLMATSRH